jgi:hypothetical protein
VPSCAKHYMVKPQGTRRPVQAGLSSRHIGGQQAAAIRGSRAGGAHQRCAQGRWAGRAAPAPPPVWTHGS